MAPHVTSSAQGIGNPFAGLWSGAREVLRTLSYYEMKNRAGVVGQNGLGPLLAQLRGPERSTANSSDGTQLWRAAGVIRAGGLAR